MTMTMTTCWEPEARVTVTEAGSENLRFRKLLQQTLPLLRYPDRHSETERMALINSVRNALDEDADEENERDCPEEPRT